MLTSQQLKSELKAVASAGYPLPPAGEIDPLCQSMLAQIGSTDPELRDDLIYLTFAHWVTEGKLSPARLNSLRQGALDDGHLFHQAGSPSPEAVFTRSFSALLLALLVYAHRHNPYMTPAELQHTKDLALTYVYAESDFRGYVDGQGWAHAAAHTADLLDELAQCSEFGSEELHHLLHAVAHLVSRGHGVYSNDEDERLSVAAAGIFHRQVLDSREWSGWLEGLVALGEDDAAFPHGYNRRINIKHFLRALFFRLRREPAAPDQPSVPASFLSTELEKSIHRITKF